MTALTAGDLFAGFGGFSLGFERAGMVIEWQVEVADYESRVLAKHWPDVPRFRDIRDCGRQNLSPVDVICGGFPCQHHRVAGKRLGSDDERDMWPEFARIVRELGPRWVVAENVTGLLSVNAGRHFGGILRDLAACGYDAEWDCFPAAAFGAPYYRDRVFLLAFKSNSSYERTSRVCKGLQSVTITSRDNGKALLQKGPTARYARWSGITGNDWWHKQNESEICRVADGVPNRVDRLRGLGNAVVPQVTEWIGRRIIATDSKLRRQPYNEP